MFDFVDETPLPGSCLRCFIFLSPLIFLINCLMWLWIFSSTNFLPTLGPRRSVYTINGVCLSYNVPNFAMSLFPTVTIGFPGSLIVDIVGFTFKIIKPGASTSCSPSKFFFERRLPCSFLANFTSTARSLSSIRRPCSLVLCYETPDQPKSFQLPPQCQFDNKLSASRPVRFLLARLCLHLNRCLQCFHTRD